MILALGFLPLALLVASIGAVRIVRGRRRRRWKKAGRFVRPDCLPGLVWAGLLGLGLVSCQGRELRAGAGSDAAGLSAGELWGVMTLVGGTALGLVLWAWREYLFPPPPSRVHAAETRMQRIERYRRECQEAYLRGVETGAGGVEDSLPLALAVVSPAAVGGGLDGEDRRGEAINQEGTAA